MENKVWHHFPDEVAIMRDVNQIVVTIPYRLVQSEWPFWQILFPLLVSFAMMAAWHDFPTSLTEFPWIPSLWWAVGLWLVIAGWLWLFGNTWIAITRDAVSIKASPLPMPRQIYVLASQLNQVIVKAKPLVTHDAKGRRRMAPKEAFTLSFIQDGKEVKILHSRQSPLLLAVEVVIEDLFKLENRLEDG